MADCRSGTLGAGSFSFRWISLQFSHWLLQGQWLELTAFGTAKPQSLW